jgi:hypothetical protein
MWRKTKELRLPGRRMALPEVHLLRQGRTLSATPRLMVVSMLWRRVWERAKSRLYRKELSLAFLLLMASARSLLMRWRARLGLAAAAAWRRGRTAKRLVELALLELALRGSEFLGLAVLGSVKLQLELSSREFFS